MASECSPCSLMSSFSGTKTSAGSFIQRRFFERSPICLRTARCGHLTTTINQTAHMKNQIKRLLIGLLATASFVGTTHATDVNLEGYWGYFLQGTRTYYPYGKSQSGRYSNLGAGYYRSGSIRGGNISNDDYRRSGSLSLEFWQLDYYAAGSGRVMFTRGFSPL